MVPFQFYTIIGSSNFHRYKLRLPKSFGNRFKNRAAGFSQLSVPSGVTWDVQIFKEDREIYFGEGWSTFMKHNSISNGYFLEFEYLGNLQFKVHIFNLTCCEIEYPLHNDHSYSTEDDNQMEEENDIDFTSSRASFPMEVRLCNIVGACYMHIPKKFVRTYMRGHLSKFVKLQVNDGREWCVSCFKVTNCLRLQGPTWKKFVQENNWRIGELYKFSIVREEDDCLVLQVV